MKCRRGKGNGPLHYGDGMTNSFALVTGTTSGLGDVGAALLFSK